MIKKILSFIFSNHLIKETKPHKCNHCKETVTLTRSPYIRNEWYGGCEDCSIKEKHC
jgi:hypothetical protein